MKTTTLFLIATLASPVWAEDQPSQPVFSEPNTSTNALVAYEEIQARWEEYQAELVELYASYEGDLADFVPPHPLLQRVAWPYETCTDVVTLIPPPTGDWGISSSASNIRSPIAEDQAEITYVRYDPSLKSDDDDFYRTEEYLLITATKSPESKQLFEMLYANEAMRATMFETGPYGYPLLTQSEGTVVGDIAISVSSTNEAAAEEYLTRMLGCAIKSGFIAEQIDPSSLDDVP